MSDTRFAYVPAAYASCVEGSHDGDRKGKLDKPVQVLTVESVKATIAKMPELKTQPVTEGKDKDNNKSKTLADFLLDAAKLSESQGYLAWGDLADAASLKQITKTAGTPNFQALVRRIVSRCYIANTQGRVSRQGEAPSIDMSELDF